MKLRIFLSLVLALPSTMALAEKPCWLDVDGRPYEVISSEQAMMSSEGSVLLHFGEGFPAHVSEGIIQAVSRLDYRFCAFAGGTAGAMDLFIDGQRGKKPFSPADAMDFLLSVLEDNAGSFRDLEPEQITAQQALEWSEGRVLFHFGEGFSVFRLSQMQTMAQERGLNMIYLAGGPTDGTRVYFYGNEIPKTFTRDEAHEALVVVFGLAEKHGLIPTQ